MAGTRIEQVSCVLAPRAGPDARITFDTRQLAGRNFSLLSIDASVAPDRAGVDFGERIWSSSAKAAAMETSVMLVVNSRARMIAPLFWLLRGLSATPVGLPLVENVSRGDELSICLRPEVHFTGRLPVVVTLSLYVAVGAAEEEGADGAKS